MLDSILAQKLAKRIMKQLGYNINIMNDKGVIIASGDSKRIGDFHEIAYKIIKDKLNIGVAKEINEGIGIKAPGVNMPIVYENQIIGVVGISGNPDEIMSFAQLVKLSVETMLEHELYKEQVRRKQTNKNSFLNALLYEEPINCNRIDKLANELQYEEKYYRLPVIIKLSTVSSSSHVLSQIKNIPSHLKQDISFEIGADKIVVFKSILSDPVKSFKEKVLQYTNEINRVLADSRGASECIYYAGTLQKEYVNYRQAYQHAFWLENYLNYDKGVYFFNDYVLEYLQNNIPIDIYDGIFSAYKDALDNVGKEIFIDTIEAFYKNRLSVSDTAKHLYLHRNTVLFRLKKIKQLLGLDLLNNIYDSQLLFQILHYYKSKK